MEIYIIIICAITLILSVITLIFALRMRRLLHDDMEDLLNESESRLRQELNTNVQSTVGAFGRVIVENQQAAAAQQESRLKTFELSNEQKLEAIRQTMERRLYQMQTENNQRLDQMRQIVDEKLQKTLENKMTQSFQLVNARLEQVYKGLGEMQTLAAGVGDLKKVLSNVKTRGILGEIQLGAILEEILSPSNTKPMWQRSPAAKTGLSTRLSFPPRTASTCCSPSTANSPGICTPICRTPMSRVRQKR